SRPGTRELRPAPTRRSSDLCIAVGPATAAALMQAGIDDVVTPATAHDSEGVLDLDLLKDVHDRRLVVVSGEGGRDAIERGLQVRSEEHTSELQSRENLVCRL